MKPCIGVADCNIKDREVMLKMDENEKIDWAETFAKTIVGNNIEKYLTDNNLFKD